ncbi:sulfur carrier protein ThiS [Salsuginibacillus kocurii]|uniref:sulfur carrier protein ThiS n=1 Tax=Salsuginibacillus kocurii TaxID=427078 RepID=UPI00037BBCCA|nr:sulfur carrier protein ThiS [Salsuginibacillus kocurii]
MQLWINGEQEQLHNVSTLYDVVKHYGLENRMVATEVDGVIIDRSEWADQKLSEGTQIELVHFVGGG